MQVPLSLAQELELPSQEVKQQKFLALSVAGPEFSGCQFPDRTRIAPHRPFATFEEAEKWRNWLTSSTPCQAPILILPTNFTLVLARKESDFSSLEYQRQNAEKIFAMLSQWKDEERQRVKSRMEKVTTCDSPQVSEAIRKVEQEPPSLLQMCRDELEKKAVDKLRQARARDGSDQEAKQQVEQKEVQKEDKQKEDKQQECRVTRVPMIQMTQYALIPEMFRDPLRSCVLMTCIYRIGKNFLAEPLVIFHFFFDCHRGMDAATRTVKQWHNHDKDFWLGRTLTIADCHRWCDGYSTKENSDQYSGTFEDSNEILTSLLLHRRDNLNQSKQSKQSKPLV